MSEESKEALVKSFLTPISSPEHMRDWVYTYLGLDMPVGTVDPESNSSPMAWLFEAYNTLRLNLGNKIPGYIVYAPREGYKTLTTAILEILCAVHFVLPVAHMAAIESQAKKSAQYVNAFVRKIKPYLDAHGMTINKANSRNVEFVDKDGSVAYITLIICTLQGANCIHPDSIVHFSSGVKKPAHKVSPGDMLKTWDYTTQEMVDVEVGSVSYTEKPAREIIFDDSSNIIVSDDHPVFTQKGWVLADQVQLKDRFTDFGDISATNPSNNQLTAKVLTINSIGDQKLIDIHIKTSNEHQKSFIINSGKLVHNSEHTSLFCVGGNTEILIENPSDKMNRKRQRVKARLLYARLRKGQKFKVLSLNHSTGKLEFKSIVGCAKSKKNLITLNLEQDKSIVLTSEHRMFVFGKGYFKVEDISVGDELLFLDKNSRSDGNIKIQLIKVKEKIGDELDYAYDFTVEGNHNYWVNNFLSHNCIDEIDVVRFPNAYEESKMIPGVMRGKFPICIKTSTRKFAFGLMQKEIDNAKDSGDTVLHWNIIDVTERCPEERHLPKKKKIKRWIRPRELPLSNLDDEQMVLKSDEEKEKYVEIEAYAGCKDCSLLPVCQMRLAHRSKRDSGGLWKPIDFVVNQFKKISPDMAEAQLMCWKPSSKGLVYPKFSTDLQDGNVYTLEQAYRVLSGEDPPQDLNYHKLIQYMLHLGIQFFGHVDWGFRHNYALVVTAQIPNGEWWVVHTVAIPGLELDEMVKIALEQRAYFKIKRWHADTAQPSYIKTFKKNGMACSRFKKDIDAGIEAVRKQVIDAYGKRRLKVLLTEHNDFAVKGFQNHHFKLDAAGNPTREPDDEEYADVMDSMRYGGQNLFKPSSGITVPRNAPYPNAPAALMNDRHQYSDWMTERVRQLTHGDTTVASGKSKSGTIFFDFGASTFESDDDES